MKKEPKKLGRPFGDGKKKAKPSLSIDPDLIAELEAARDKTGLSVSALVTACCKLRLPKLLRDLLEPDSSEGGSSSIAAVQSPPKKKNGTNN